MTDRKKINDVISKIVQDQQRIDFLVNNAGYGAIGPVVEMPGDKLYQQFETNVFAPINLIQAVFPNMVKSGGGCIVNIGSISGILVTPFAGAYCASKASVHALSDSLRMELAPFNIRVVTVQPGAIQSNFGNRAHNEVKQNVTKNSFYAEIIDAIQRRAYSSQENPTPAEKLAKKLVKELMKKNPKTTIRVGRGSHSLPFLKRWLPQKILDKILIRKFNLNKPGLTD